MQFILEKLLPFVYDNKELRVDLDSAFVVWDLALPSHISSFLDV